MCTCHSGYAGSGTACRGKLTSQFLTLHLNGQSQKDPYMSNTFDMIRIVKQLHDPSNLY